MSELTVGSRYAKSLIDLAVEQNSLEAVRGDMELFVQTLKTNHQLQTVLANPIISHDKKIKILDGLFEGKVSKATIGFFNIMINKSRGEVLFYTAQEFINQYNAKNNIVKAKIVTAVELSEANKKTVTDLVKAEVGGDCSIILETKVDPTLIGGFILTVGDRQIDNSIANSLKKLKNEFAHGVVE